MPTLKLTLSQADRLREAIALISPIADTMWNGVEAGAADPKHIALNLGGVLDVLIAVAETTPHIVLAHSVPQGGNEYAIISADRPVEYGTLDGNTIKVRPLKLADPRRGGQS